MSVRIAQSAPELLKREAGRLSRPSRLRPICHAVTLMLVASTAMNAHAATNLANLGAQMNAARNAAAASGRVPGMSPQQALQASLPSIQNLAHAAQGIAQQIAAQQAAAAAGVGAASNVPNGLAVGGLQVAPGASSDISNPALWINANLPTQTVDSNGHVDVEVKQTAQNAVVTWQTMNVGRQTTLNFDQSGGTQNNGANSWVVLNRIEDPSGRPSQILGNVTAQGSVYVINRNGIVFGAGSQVNVHSLVASSMDLLNTNDDNDQLLANGKLVQSNADIVASNQLFLSLPAGTDGGLSALEQGENNPSSGTSAGVPNEVLGLGNVVALTSTSQYQAPGDITIAPGASITTHTDGTVSDGGFVLIAASNVNNGGNISATGGQVILAAGVGLSLEPDTLDPQILVPVLSGRITLGSQLLAPDITPVGTLTNTGIVQAARGTIDLLGTNVNQNGVVGATTSISAPGGITISTVDEYTANTPTGTAYPGEEVLKFGFGSVQDNRAGQLIFGNGSVTTVLPDEDGETATSAPGSAFTPGSITLTAGSVWFQSGSLIEAPGSTVSVTALSPLLADDETPAGDTLVPGRIYLDTGATIDVSGLANVELPIADILLTVPLVGPNELADSPLLRDGFLDGLKDVVVDSTLSGTNLDGSQWVGTPLLNLAGAVSLMPRTIDQLLTNGGTITLSGAQVMTADGSSLNLNGGYIHYDGGIVNTTRLTDVNGAIVPIGQASPYDTYVGVAGEFVESHPRWGITKDWFDPLLNGGSFEPDFIVGGNAGTLNVFASQALVLDGDISAQAFGGEKQVQDNDQPVGGSFTLGLKIAQSTRGVDQDTTAGEPGTVILQDKAPQLDDLSPGFSAATPLDVAALGALASTDPDNVQANTVVPVDTLNNGGFANVSVAGDPHSGTGIIVAAGTQLKVQAGGSITFSSPASGITVLGNLIAPSGTISLAAGNDVVVGPDSLISVAGQWVNNSDDSLAATGDAPGDSEYINGGSITLSTLESGFFIPGLNLPGIPLVEGGIELQAGSVLDVSSGGELQSNGQLLTQNGIPEGLGGSVSLIAFSNQASQYQSGGGGGTRMPTDTPTSPLIQMDGTIKSFGFAGGGTLTLQALGFQIGGDPDQAPAWDLYLPADFFAQQGFGNYVLNAMFDTTVAPGTMVRLTQQNLIPDLSALQQAATGADITAGDLSSVGTLDAYHRQATNLVMTGGAFLLDPIIEPAGATGGVSIGEGASIVADAGASIGLGSPVQVTVLGSIIAPGGSITLSADSTQNVFSVTGQATTALDGFPIFTSLSKSVWLGSDAVLDVAGVALVNPLAAPVHNGLQTFVPDTGKVLPGGSVTISDDSGYVIAQAGSLIDVSGTSTTFDELQSNGQYAPQLVWSDAGSITLGASSGLLFDGTLKGQPGAAQAQGGTLTLLAEQGVATNAQQPDGVSAPQSGPAAQVLILQQSGNLVPAGLMPGQDIPAALGTQGGEPTGALQFAADRLTGSGISTLVVNAISVNGNADQTPVPVVFTGDVNLTLANTIQIAASQIVALSHDDAVLLESGAIDPSTGNAYTVASLLAAESTTDTSSATGTSVTINAPYVALIGPVTNFVTPPPIVQAGGDGTLDIHASFIDLENQVQLDRFGQANFTSSGDIRLSSTNDVPSAGSLVAFGELFTSGNLTFDASDIYPATGSAFILAAVGPDDVNGNPLPTTITFLSNGASGVPLSAGGSLLVDATNIVQSGTVRAPFGSLIFGVGDPGDPATQTQFNNLPLVATESVSLTSGSVSSVSSDGTLIPYGTTLDGVEWQFNPIAASPQPDVTAPPSKLISVNGSNVSLNAGATIDLSGGGDLQAEEWVPGTGGSRDVLSQYNISFATNPSGTPVPILPGAGNVYAILPGKQSPVAAYDPIFAQTVQPSTNGNGTSGSATDSMGVGQAAFNGEVGQSVYLSGVPGLAAGFYTLLPAKYATLPGAFRVTVASASGPQTPGLSQRLPDGTEVVAGYMGNAIDGSHSATTTLFDVQSGAVWQQYSQYTLTSANNFFPALAASAGNITPQLPVDAGHLVIAATTALSLGAKLDATPAEGGAPAEVDIASQDIQIVGKGEAPLAGYLTISADELDALGAGSLLLGGTRTQTTSGVTIDAIANSVVVSNDAADPLTGPEVMLVTKTDPNSTDPNAANGLRIDGGSVIAASGSYPAAKDVPITIGVAPDSSGVGGVSGDGAFLSVSNGGDSVVTRVNTTPVSTNAGLLTVDAGATLTGGQALTLDSSGNLTFDPSAQLSGTIIAVDAGAITFTDQSGAAAAALQGFVAGSIQIAQLANAQEVILRSAGTMYFDGSVDVSFGNKVDLSAGEFSSDGGAATINAPEVAFTNEMGAPVPDDATSGSGTLTVNASEIDFGTGDKTVNGLSSATFNATGGIVGQGTGTFDFGTLPVTMNAPVYLADTSSDTTLKTTGVLNLNTAAGTALALVPVGGALSFVGGTINDNNATIEAPAGNVSLEATSGDLTIGSGSVISSAGVSKQFFDITVYAPAGSISLTADTGTVNAQAGSTLDFSGASGGGAAGNLTLSAPDQTVQLAGTIKGTASAGFLGGSFSLNTGGAIDLDNLAAELASSGVDDAITVQTHAGNLTLSAGNTITAHGVSLTADGGAGGQDPNNGNVQILGTIDASGNAGGEIDLYGKSGVDLEGSLIATGSSATQRGGTVNIGTTAIGNNTDINSTYGYENIASAQSGSILLGGNAVIDVTGGTAGGLSGGTVNFRAPLVGTENGPGSVNVTIVPGAQIKGSRATTLEAYAVWSTDDHSTGAQHFDGIVDPAGWYDSSGNLQAGTFTEQGGNTFTFVPDGTGGGSLTDSSGTTTDITAAQLTNGDPAISFGGLTSDFFAPQSTPVGTDHQTFYGYIGGDATNGAGTLMSFVQNGVQGVADQFAGNGIRNFAVVPGIELDNPDADINGGNISILTSWNLGAGTSLDTLAFRFHGEAPVITFRAKNDVKVDASLTDGFFQITNPTNPGSSTQVVVPGYASYNTTLANYNTQAEGPYAGDFYGGSFPEGTLAYYGVNGPNSKYAGVDTAPVNFSAGTTPFKAGDTVQGEVNEYLALYEAYANLLLATNQVPGEAAGLNALLIAQHRSGTIAPAPHAPSAQEQQQDPVSYLTYLASYQNYIDSSLAAGLGVQVPVAPTPQLVTEISAAPGSVITVSSPSPTDNTPSPLASAANPLPLASSSLAGGSSTSFRLVAGADLNSANPLGLQAAAIFKTGGGDVTVDGHFAYVDTTHFAAIDPDQTLLAPTMIRTGTGSIDIAAGGDIVLSDPSAPGVIYTGGTPAAGAPTPGSVDAIVTGQTNPNAVFVAADVLVTPTVNPDSGGDISLHAQGNITGIENVVDSTGAITTATGTNISQFWMQWMEIGTSQTVVFDNLGQPLPDLPTTQSSIDFGAFDQGVMSVGGNVTVSAGGNISDLAVSLPTTWYLNSSKAPVTVGGGNLTVTAGGNILSGDYFVANGTGTITAGGSIGSDIELAMPGIPGVRPVAMLLATQDGVFNVNARQGIDIGGVFDPSYLQSNILRGDYLQHPDEQAYSATSAVNVESTTGDILFGTLGGTLPGPSGTSTELPATVSLIAFTGGISVVSPGELFPSPIGNLSLIADQTIQLSGSILGRDSFGMSDADPSSMPSPTDQSAVGDGHDSTALHADDTVPVRIYSLNGSIVDGILEPQGSPNAGQYDSLEEITLDKPALIYAGQDIVNLVFEGQNLRDADVTRIVAGRDIDDAPNLGGSTESPSLLLGGPGTFDIEAGRNIGPLTQATGGVGASPFSGIDAVGNALNPNLPHESANIQVLFGVGPGIDDADFIAAYINPASAAAAAGVPGTTAALVAFMEQYDAGQVVDTGLAVSKPVPPTLSADQAWAQFQALPDYVRQLFVEKVFFNILTDVGNDFNNPASPFFNQYARGFQAINTLFPASFGYTANNLSGGGNGANAPVETGNLDIRSTTIQTQQGGNISIFGPGGQALVGSSSAPPEKVDTDGQVIAGPGTMGILTLEQGDVDIFTDQSLLLAQSRVFTEQGGGMTIWSSNGNIDAGKGSTSVADVPPPEYVCDANHFCTVDARGEVTGAGIATLQTIPGAAPGDVNLIAPRGTVDAGAAGIRVSGNLNVAALHVANTDNIQVQGKTTGVPVVAAVDTGALTAASAATSAVTQMAQSLVRNNASGVPQRHWIITVQVEGFGDSGEDDRKKRKASSVSYNSSSPVSVLGFGELGRAQRTYLTDDEKGRL